MLANPIYMGITYVGRTHSVSLGGRKRRVEAREQADWLEIPDATPLLVTPEKFEAAQQGLLNSPRRRTGKPSNKYLLTGHISCGYCGGTMAGSILSGRYRYYYCRATRPDAKSVGKCKARYVKAEQLEAAVVAELSSILERPDVVLNELLKREDEGSPLLNDHIDQL